VHQCVICSSGMYLAADAETCVACPAGLWTENMAGQRQCKPRPVDCVAAAWEPWSSCDKTCGPGRQYRERQAVTHAAHGGAECVLDETRSCTESICPVDCEVEVWSAWSACSAKCGGGVSHRKRSVTTAAMHGGKPCPPIVAWKACNTQHCVCSHVHCRVVPGTQHVQILHQKHEIFGHTHRCKFNRQIQECQCLCGSSEIKSSTANENAPDEVAVANQAEGWKLPLWDDAEEMKQAMGSWKRGIYGEADSSSSIHHSTS